MPIGRGCCLARDETTHDLRSWRWRRRDVGAVPNNASGIAFFLQRSKALSTPRTTVHFKFVRRRQRTLHAHSVGQPKFAHH